MKIPEQIKRLAVVVAVIVVGAVVTRFVIIPRSLVAMDLHQESTVQRELVKPVRFAGSATCQNCHDDIFAKKQAGFHKNLSCEGCHGPSTKHAEDPGEVKPFAPRDRKFCPVCHGYDASRPTGFPQINPTSHNPLKPCISCHNPHDPVPSKLPQSCAACHGQIERTKAVSSHALLACTTCHQVPEQHKKEPRRALPSKPGTREFCEGCHRQGSPQADAPKIDVAAHGGTYLCWQCHYPHLPGG